MYQIHAEQGVHKIHPGRHEMAMSEITVMMGIHSPCFFIDGIDRNYFQDFTRHCYFKDELWLYGNWEHNSQTCIPSQRPNWQR